MTTVTIPAWTARGVLPPENLIQAMSADRSPYLVKLLDVVMRFATTPERWIILKGFLDYRCALHNIGLKQGFQWLNGSFAEHVELLEQRAPQDIDVVNFVHVPPNFSPTPDQADVLDHDHAKAVFSVDSYFVEVNLLPPENLVKQSTYWYSMWSHRRNQEWKGYLQWDLSSVDDALAAAWLNSQMEGGATL